MRLFIAVNFPAEVKEQIYNIMTKLRPHVLKGNFTLKENLHLTLAFIGETNKTGAIIAAMDKIEARPFSLSLNGLGRFGRDGGVLWIGVGKSAELSEINRVLKNELEGLGFPIDKREYKPHLTIGREVVFKEGFDLKAFSGVFRPISTKISFISLMKSERIGGKLTYTEIYAKNMTK